MIVDGERLKGLVHEAKREVVICAPFIKVAVLRTILSCVDDRVVVRIITRWRACEVAMGVSDLEVFELANARARTELKLLDDLHAKLYLADDGGLAGSANLTATALGWVDRSNVELLMPVLRTDPDVRLLLQRLEQAYCATYAMRSEVADEAANLSVAPAYKEPDLSDATVEARSRHWLPSCATPGQLRAIYQDAETTAVIRGTREDGLTDLRDLQIPSGLTAHEFETTVRETLKQFPSFRRITDRLPEGLTDAAGIDLILEIRPDLSRAAATTQWRIVRDWISEFFRDDFEVAPDSFVVRLKPR